MTSLQKIQMRQSELRETVNGLLAKPELSPEESTELEQRTAEFQHLEVRYRAALAISNGATETVQTGDLDGAGRELAALVQGSAIANYMATAMRGEGMSGREAEANAALGIKSGGATELPLIMLLPQEERADAVTTLATTTAPRTPGRWLDRVFASTGARYLGVTMEDVAVGERTHPVLTGGSAAATVARGGTQDAAAALVSSVNLAPHRLTAKYIFAYEDAARFMGLEEHLRRDLAGVIGDQMDNSIFDGNGELTSNGLQSLGAAQTSSIATYTSADYDDIYAVFTGLLDGRYARQYSDIKGVLAPKLVSEKLVSLSQASVRKDLHEAIANLGIMWQSSANVHDGAVAVGSDVGFFSLAMGLPGAAVCAMWPSIQLIRDPYTQASEGQVAITSIVLWDFAIVRAQNFHKLDVTALS